MAATLTPDARAGNDLRGHGGHDPGHHEASCGGRPVLCRNRFPMAFYSFFRTSRPGRAQVLAAGALVALLGTSVVSAAPRLGLPVDCKPGSTCFVQSYVDHDPGSAARDHLCGTRTHDGHAGTDFRLRDRATMDAGVGVLAAAKGKVESVRTGEPDVSVRQGSTEAIRGRECGNGVVIDHGGGWKTQYCHLRRGSIRVRQGESVKAGAPLGLIGLSGLTAAPHLHFEVRKDDRPVDPFSAAAVSGTSATRCSPRSVLWSSRAAAALSWQAVTLIDAAFTSSEPTLQDVATSLPPNPTSVSPSLVAWVRVLGLRAGDVETLTVIDPLNSRFVEEGPVRLERDEEEHLIIAGRKRDIPSWPLGNYNARYTLARDGKIILERDFSFSLVR